MRKDIDIAVEEARKAQRHVLDVMQRELPMGLRVGVVHSRGAFFAHVVGWDLVGYRIIVINEQTGKRSKRWYREVERA